MGLPCARRLADLPLLSRTPALASVTQQRRHLRQSQGSNSSRTTNPSAGPADTLRAVAGPCLPSVASGRNLREIQWVPRDAISRPASLQLPRVLPGAQPWGCRPSLTHPPFLAECPRQSTGRSHRSSAVALRSPAPRRRVRLICPLTLQRPLALVLLTSPPQQCHAPLPRPSCGTETHPENAASHGNGQATAGTS